MSAASAVKALLVMIGIFAIIAVFGQPMAAVLIALVVAGVALAAGWFRDHPAPVGTASGNHASDPRDD